ALKSSSTETPPAISSLSASTWAATSALPSPSSSCASGSPSRTRKRPVCWKRMACPRRITTSPMPLRTARTRRICISGIST
ncbi:hypothetical protein KXW86_008742, partial [Aspergillus fumigatus]